MSTLSTKIKRLMSEQESLTLKKRYIINSIEKLDLGDRMAILKVIESVDRDQIKTLSYGSAYDLDKCPLGLISVLCYTISNIIEKNTDTGTY